MTPQPALNNFFREYLKELFQKLMAIGKLPPTRSGALRRGRGGLRLPLPPGR